MNAINDLLAASLGMGAAILAVLLLCHALGRRVSPLRRVRLLGLLSALSCALLLLSLVGRDFWVSMGIASPFSYGLGQTGLIPFGFAPEYTSSLMAGYMPRRLQPVEIAGYVYLAGVAAYLLCRAVPYARFRLRVRRESRPAGERAQAAFYQVLQSVSSDPPQRWKNALRVMPSLPGPVSVIYWPKVLLLDREDYDDETLDAILRHELMHTWHSGIAARRCLRLLAAALQWFNPAAWLLGREQRAQEECACDQAANDGRSPEQKRAYARAMVRLAAKPKREIPGTAHMACGAKLLRRRVEAVFQSEAPQDPLSGLGRAALTALSVLLLLGGALALGQPGHYRATEENLPGYLGVSGMSTLSAWKDIYPPLAASGNALFCRLNAEGTPYGAEHVYFDFFGNLYLQWPAGVDEAGARAQMEKLAAHLDAMLGERTRGVGETVFSDRAYGLLFQFGDVRAVPMLGRWEMADGTTIDLFLWEGVCSLELFASDAPSASSPPQMQAALVLDNDVSEEAWRAEWFAAMEELLPREGD